jgi:hypothetical protein
MNSNVKNAEIFMNPFAFVQTAKTRALAPVAGEMKAINNCPSFHPPDPAQAWIWVVPGLPVLARPAAVFREPDDQCSRALRLLTIRKYKLNGNLKHSKKRKRHEHLDHFRRHCRMGSVTGLYSAQNGHFHMNE